MLVWGLLVSEPVGGREINNMANILTRLFSGDEDAKKIVSEYSQLAKETHVWLTSPETNDAAYENEMGKKSDRATDIFINHDLYDYAVYAGEQQGTEG